MLLHNIGQFLKRTALEWYAQVSTSTYPPTNWDAFQVLFLPQFTSPPTTSLSGATMEEMHAEAR